MIIYYINREDTWRVIVEVAFFKGLPADWVLKIKLKLQTQEYAKNLKLS